MKIIDWNISYAGDTSTKIDVMQLETMVEYETELDIGDNLEDAIEKWKVFKN